MKHKFLLSCLCVALAVALFSGVFAIMGWGSLLRDVGGTIIYPFQWIGHKTAEGIRGFVRYFSDMDDLLKENESLRAENESLRGEMLEAEIQKDELSRLYAYLEIKEGHTDYSLCPALVVANSTVSTTSPSGEGDGTASGDDLSGNRVAISLTLNKGSRDGVRTGMPVITPEGLCGVVVEVEEYACQVATVLDPSVSVGAVTSRGGENGLLEGDNTRLYEGCATLRYLRSEADIEMGDLVVTAGIGSVYPFGIPIGRVTKVYSNAFSRTTEAVVIPFVDLSDVRHVAILLDYDRTVEMAEDAGGGS